MNYRGAKHSPLPGPVRYDHAGRRCLEGNADASLAIASVAARPVGANSPGSAAAATWQAEAWGTAFAAGANVPARAAAATRGAGTAGTALAVADRTTRATVAVPVAGTAVAARSVAEDSTRAG